jgi:hypothetical protein
VDLWHTLELHWKGTLSTFGTAHFSSQGFCHNRPVHSDYMIPINNYIIDISTRYTCAIHPLLYAGNGRRERVWNAWKLWKLPDCFDF